MWAEGVRGVKVQPPRIARKTGPPSRRHVIFRRMFALLRSAVLLFAYLLLGDAFVALSGAPVPGSVVGMVLLTLSLRLGVVKVAHVVPAADVLLRHMAFLFVPPGVGIVVYLGLLRAEWVEVVVANLFGTFAVLITVGVLQQRQESRQAQDGPVQEAAPHG
jgi:holin-like protein